MSIVLIGSTSGSCTLQEQAVAGTTTLTLPTITGTVGVLVSGTAVASTSGTSIDFTGIPAGVRRITVMFNGVSTSSTSNPLIQLGDSGGVETTSYSGVSTSQAGTVTSYTTGFGISNGSGSLNLSGTIVLVNVSTNIWVANGFISAPTANSFLTGGVKELSATLDRVRITTVNGTDTFDAGTINILYE